MSSWAADVTQGGSPLSLTLLVHPTNTVYVVVQKSQHWRAVRSSHRGDLIVRTKILHGMTHDHVFGVTDLFYLQNRKTASVLYQLLMFLTVIRRKKIWKKV